MATVTDFTEIKNKFIKDTYKCNEKGDKLSTEWNEKLADVMLDLREYVHNINKAPKLIFKHGIYQARDQSLVQVTKCDGWEIGYQVKEIGGGFFQRKVFLMCEQDMLTVPEADRDPVFETALHVFMDVGAGEPEMDLCASNCMMITQNFAVAFLSEKSPNLVNHKGHI